MSNVSPEFVADWPITKAAKRWLIEFGVITTSDLLALSQNDLAKHYPHIGPYKAKKIAAMLAEYDLCLRDDMPNQAL